MLKVLACIMLVLTLAACNCANATWSPDPFIHVLSDAHSSDLVEVTPGTDSGIESFLSYCDCEVATSPTVTITERVNALAATDADQVGRYMTASWVISGHDPGGSACTSISI